MTKFRSKNLTNCREIAFSPVGYFGTTWQDTLIIGLCGFPEVVQDGPVKS